MFIKLAIVALLSIAGLEIYMGTLPENGKRQLLKTCKLKTHWAGKTW